MLIEQDDLLKRNRDWQDAFYESMLDLIGNTPIVDISALSPNPKAGAGNRTESRGIVRVAPGLLLST